MTKVWKALNDDTRREILDLLKKGDLNAGEIFDNFDIARSSISHHLDLLRQANLVSSYKQGQFVYYTLNTTVLDELIEWIISIKKEKDE